jgi:small conductance mechanosensitive channel
MEEQLRGSGEYIDTLINLLVVWGPKLVGAVLALIIGLYVVNMIAGGIDKMMVKKELDPSLRPFLKSLVSSLLKVLVVISVLGMIGIQMTSFIAILGAAGLAVGLALSGTLQNFSGGVMILTFKPFKVGDYIDAQGFAGTVNSIQIFNTILKTPDNKTIIIPNSGLATSSMVNYSTEPTRRVDWVFGIAYGDDIDKAKEVLLVLLTSNGQVLKDPAPFVSLGELAESSVNFTVRAWVNSADYWSVHFYMLENVYRKFAEAGLNIPFPQMDVHLDKEIVV